MRWRGVDEDRDVGHPVLQQVTDPFGVVLEQPERVPRLEILRQHEHADLGMLGSDRVGGDEAFVGVGRRHLDVDDHEVGTLCCDGAEQLVGIAGLGDDLEARLFEEEGNALADERRVVGDGYSHGSSACSRRVPPPRSTVTRPSSAPTRSSMSISDSSIVPSLSTSTDNRPFECDAATVARVARVRSSVSVITKYAARSTAPSRRRSGRARTCTAAGDDRVNVSIAAASPSSASTAGKIPCASSLSSARVEAQLRVGVGEPGLELGARRLTAGPHYPEGEGESDESLLCPVVEVALEAAALEVAGFDDAHARRPQVLELGADVGPQAFVLHREASGRDELFDPAGIAEQHGVVDESGNRLAIAQQGRDGATGAGIDGDGPAVGIDESVGTGRAKRDLQPGVAERTRERVARSTRPRGVLEVDDELRDRGPSAERVEDSPRGTTGDRHERDRLPSPQPQIDGIVAQHVVLHAVMQVERDEHEERGGRHEHGRNYGSPRSRAPEPYGDESHERDRPREFDPDPPPEAVGERGAIVVHHEQIARALEASLGRGVEHRGREEPEQPDAARISHGDRAALDRGRDATARVEERRVRDKRRARDDPDQTHGERERDADAGVAPLGEKERATPAATRIGRSGWTVAGSRTRDQHRGATNRPRARSARRRPNLPNEPPGSWRATATALTPMAIPAALTATPTPVRRRAPTPDFMPRSSHRWAEGSPRSGFSEYEGWPC